MYTKIKILIGEENFKKIQAARICVAGIGGVGGYVVENLVRSGIQNLCIIDCDVVDESNINRQIIATKSTVGRLKVEVMKERVLDINPEINLEICDRKMSPTNLATFHFERFDFVIDCIDMRLSKIALIEHCTQNNIKIISALGTGNRFGLPNFEVKDIFETQNDPLAKMLRKRLRKLNVTSLPCVCSNDLANIKRAGPASVMWQPCTAACLISAWVMNQIVENE